MLNVDRFREEDVGAVADLHNRIYLKSERPGSKSLQAYYLEVFLKNPWYDEALPSLVYRMKGGKVVGFIGRISRPMTTAGRTVTMAVAHRLMVSPESRSRLAAMELLMEFLSGPQDLSYTDGANDVGQRILWGAGFSPVYLYSMNWFRPLRPCAFALNVMRSKSTKFASAAAALSPLGRLLDLGAVRLGFGQDAPDTTEWDVDAATLKECIDRFSRDHVLRPIYDTGKLEWLLRVLHSYRSRGDLRGFIVRGRDGRSIGVCLYYLKAQKIADILLIAALKDSHETVFQHVLHHASVRGIVGLSGMLEPRFLPCFWRHNCLVKRGDWAMVHSRDVGLRNVVSRGDAFLSALEGERWLLSPFDNI